VITGGGLLTDNSNDSFTAYNMSLISGTESAVETPLANVGSTLTDLHVRVSTAPGGTASWTLTIDKNGNATALSCTITGAATTCNDSSLVPVSPGDTITLKVTPFGSPALTNLIWSAKITP
jgi:hypothetical protein